MTIVVAAILRRDQSILIAKRPAGVHLADFWEFPGGKVERGESLSGALKRELHEELGIDAEILMESYTTTHHYNDRSVELHFFECAIARGEPQAIQAAELRWVKPPDLLSYNFPEADRELVERLARPHPSL